MDLDLAIDELTVGWSVQPCLGPRDGATAASLQSLPAKHCRVTVQWLTSMTTLRLSHRLGLSCRYLSIQHLAPATHWSLLVMPAGHLGTQGYALSGDGAGETFRLETRPGPDGAPLPELVVTGEPWTREPLTLHAATGGLRRWFTSRRGPKALLDDTARHQ